MARTLISYWSGEDVTSDWKINLSNWLLSDPLLYVCRGIGINGTIKGLERKFDAIQVHVLGFSFRFFSQPFQVCGELLQNKNAINTTSEESLTRLISIL